MSRISIIRSDNAIVVDGVPHNVDCSSLDPHIHAIQWYGSAGHVEFVDEDPNDGQRDANLTIVDFSPYQHLVEAWEAAKAAQAACTLHESEMPMSPAQVEACNLHVLAD